MAEVTIQIPDGYDLKQVADGKWELVKSEKKIFIHQILDKDNVTFLSTSLYFNTDKDSRKRALGFLALSKLKCVADYLNEGWEPDWSDYKYNKYFIAQEQDGILRVFSTKENCGGVYFKSDELAAKAIEICGEDMIRDIFDM